MLIKSAIKVSFLDIKSMYSKSILGVFWFFFNPILFFMSYYFFCVEMMGFQINGLSKMDSFLYITLGLSSFLFLSNALLPACNGLVGSLDLFKNTSYDPVSFLIKFIFLSLFTYIPLLTLCISGKFLFLSTISAYSFLLFIIYLSIFILFVASLVFLFSGISVFIRDFLNILQCVIYCIMFVSPFGMRGNALVEKSAFIYYLNPINYFIVPFQDIIFYDSPPPLERTLILAAVVLLLFYISKKFFDAVKVYMSDHA